MGTNLWAKSTLLTSLSDKVSDSLDKLVSESELVAGREKENETEKGRERRARHRLFPIIPLSVILIIKNILHSDLLPPLC